ncbi:unnamed protein product [Auanema sp. JU1783]|nr:unnamed protein product [Auanema sp. JU1783]
MNEIEKEYRSKSNAILKQEMLLLLKTRYLLREASGGTLPATVIRMSPTVIGNIKSQNDSDSAANNGKIKISGKTKSKEINGTLSPPTNVSDEDEGEEPQMSTPDDPVIHSPPSLSGQLMNGYNPNQITKIEEGVAQNCSSPETSSIDPNANDDSRRRQKTCRVCGDHATGYNFNVITCESCKAFFRRNALRPKEFKCPYSEDCEINAVSRRFCQKCRLRKCFAVGMKKEWILNDEQLRRRKNSRLNNLANQQKIKQQEPDQPQSQPQSPNDEVKQNFNSPSLNNSLDQQLVPMNGRSVGAPLVSPPGATYNNDVENNFIINQSDFQSTKDHIQKLFNQGRITSLNNYPLMSPSGSTASDSPPSRSVGILGGQRSPDAYDPNMMMQQRIRSSIVRPNPSTPSPVAVDAQSGKVILSIDDYQNLVQLAGSKPVEEPPNKSFRPSYSPNLGSPQARPFCSPIQGMQVSSPTMMQPTPRPGIGGLPTYIEIGNSTAAVPSSDHTASGVFGTDFSNDKVAHMKVYFDKTIEDALKIDSPQVMQNQCSRGLSENVASYGPSDPRMNFQLNAMELRDLDMVAEAFKGMNDPMEQGRQRESFLKKNKTPADIMNIMDVAMRRLVKMAKRLPAFNDLSQDGKFALLKAAMVEMLTIRGLTRFDGSKGVWRSPTVKGEVPFDMFDQLKDSHGEQKNRVYEFFQFFHDDIRTNDLAIALIMLIVMFSPRDCITDERDKNHINMFHEHYCKVLKRYLESLYGEDAHKLFTQLPSALAMLKDISHNAGMLFLGTVDSSETEALPREIFKVE